MDLDYAITLRPEELEYELELRGIFNLPNVRARTAALRDILNNEEAGVSIPPKSSAHLRSADEELIICTELFHDVINVAETAIANNQPLGVCESSQRLHHLMMRLERVLPVNEEQNSRSTNLLDCIYEAICGLFKATRAKELNLKNCSLLGRSIRRPLPSTKNIMLNRGSDTVSAEISGMLFDTRGAAAINTNEINLGLDTDGAHNGGDGVSLIEFDDIGDENRGVIDSDRLSRQSTITEAAASHSLGRVLERQSQDRRQKISSPILGERHTTTPGHLKTNLNNNAFSRQTIIPQNSIGLRTNSNLGNIYRANGQPFVNSRPQITSSRQPVNNFANTNQNFTSNPGGLNFSFRRSEVGNNVTNFEQTGRNLNFPTLQQQNINYEDFDPTYSKRLPNRPVTPYQYNNFSGGAYDVPASRPQFEPANRRSVQFANPENNQHFNRTAVSDNHNNQSAWGYRKSVPVHQWRISFSGEGRGMHLCEFLSQITMLQRAEMVSDHDILYSVVHLLSGRAKLWYQSVIDSIFTWQELVSEMKKEFLPDNYDYSLLCEISNRAQRSNETFGEFITEILASFRYLSIPVTEEHKLYIIKKNLLPRFSLGVAPLEITSLQRLIDVCRKIENANIYSTKNQALPFQRQSEKFRRVNVVDHENFGETEEEEYLPEVCAFRRGDGNSDGNAHANPFRSNNATNNTSKDGNNLICWNCRRKGHSFRECQKSQNGLFCYRCGAKDFTAARCPNCLGNERPNSNERVDSDLMH